MNNPLSGLITNNLPGFVREDYPIFSEFIHEYFKFLETDDNFLSIVEKYKNNNDPNNQVYGYIDNILHEMGFDIQKDLSIDKKTLVHILKDFYVTRGSPESFNILFKILYNKSAEINYPRDNLFTTSSANYSSDLYVITSAEIRKNDNYKLIENEFGSYTWTLFGVTSRKSVSAEKIESIFVNGKYYLKIFISSSRRDFSPFETIQIKSDNYVFNETIYPYASFAVNVPGENYKIGDSITLDSYIKGVAQVDKIKSFSINSIIISDVGVYYKKGDRIYAKKKDEGNSFTAIVDSVNANGEIQSVRILNGGYNYTLLPELVIDSKTGMGGKLTADVIVGQIESIKIIEPYFDYNTATLSIDSSNGTGASINIIPRCVYKTNSRYKNSKGVLGINGILTDSNYFQNFSYSIKSEVSRQDFDYMVDKYIHPSGQVRFNSLTNTQTISLDEITSLALITIIISIIDILNANIKYETSSLYTIKLESTNQLQIFSINKLEYYKTFSTFNYPALYFGNTNLDDINTGLKNMYETSDVYLQQITV